VKAGRGARAAAAGLAGWLLLGLVPGACRDARSRPATASAVRNVVLVSLDTLRADRVGGRRGAIRLTPRLDAFAARAVRFTNCRSVCGHTLASHKAILSGRLPVAFLRAFSHARDPGARALPPGAYYRAARESEAFDLARDQGETRNLFGSDRPDVRSLMEHAAGVAVGPLRGLGGGAENLEKEGVPPETVESLRKLGYVED
jgi:hypothetical protein